MRVIEQARLWFREGASDKVYEVDLVEVAANQYVVNFRFGRRGQALRDGTKTATPLDLKKAKTLFDKLVAEKIAGGYKHLGATGATGAPQDDDDEDDDGGTRPEPPRYKWGTPAWVVARLRIGARDSNDAGTYVAHAPLLAAIWRAGDQDVTDAEPALLELLDAPAPQYPGPAVRRYALVSALVRCATTAGLPKLEQVVADPHSEPGLRNIARLAIVRVAPDRAAALARPFLPPAMLTALERRDAAGLARAAEELLAADPQKAFGAAAALYLYNDALTRPAILAFARIARMSNAEAKVVRALFRLAELSRDAELYALIARRIDDYKSPYVGWGTDRKLVPFGPRTRSYMKRRVARILRRLGRAASPHYVPLASAILLSVADADADPVKESTHGWPAITTRFDTFARFFAFNQILYAHSKRYGRGHPVRATYRCIGSFRPGHPTPPEREEGYPELWDAAPDALWSLIRAGRALPVIEFATKALRPNTTYVAALADAALAEVLGAGHPLAQRFAFEAVRNRPLTAELARGGLASELPEANAWVLSWVTAHPAEVLRDPEMLALLVTGKNAATRDTGLALLRKQLPGEDVMRSTAARAIAILLGLDASAASQERAAAAASILLLVFAAPLQSISIGVLRDLIAHPLAANGELAGELMLRHPDRDAFPVELIEALLGSPHASLRLLGGRLLAQMPAEIAKDDLEALLLFALSPNAELREGTRTLIGAVARQFPEVGRALAERLVETLLAAQPAGVPAHVLSLLRTELAATLPKKPAPTIMKLIGALSPHAREAGGLLLGQLGPDDLGLDDVARLAHHEILAIRQGAWAIARASVDRYRIAPVALSRLVDSPWEDTRTFAIAFIRDEVKTLTADAIIAICDSIRPEVQALGKQLLHEQFQTADAGTYLVKLAEHPSPNLQLLVSGLLEHHVAGDLGRLRALVPYLVTVLSQVNRGRIAKERVLLLLRREAARSEEAARIIAPILDRQSATAAITQKHPLIATMVDIRETYPDVPLPLTLTREEHN